MAEETSFQERTEPATPRRRRKAKEKGQVARSTEINSLLILLLGICILRFVGYPIFQKSCSLFKYLWLNTANFNLTPSTIPAYFHQGVVQFLSLFSPLLIGICTIGLIANIIQGGFVFTTTPLIPDIDRINPATGLKRLFSLKSLERIPLSLFKIIIIGYIAYITIKGWLPLIFSLTGRNVEAILISMGGLIFQLVFRCCLAFLPLAIMDYAFQKWQYGKQLRMTRQEVIEEHKQTEGSPLTKARIRSLRNRIARQRMMQDVSKADVIITNPAQLAIALKYEKEKMNAPILLAKGARLIAEKIKEIARKYNIPVVENRWLAQALYKSVEVGEEIPIKFYQAVAEVLAYIYRLKGYQGKRQD